MRDIPTDNLSYGLLITIKGGGSGSGYLIQAEEKVFLVTAKHVIYDPSGNLRGDLTEVLAYTNDIEHDETIEFIFSLNKIASNNAILQNGKDDVVVIHWGNIGPDSLTRLQNEITIKSDPGRGPIAVAFSNLKSLDDVLIANNVFILGFPSSIGLKNIPQIDYKTPLVRKGIIAGKNKKLNTIILDCEVYPGNSGGPVIEVEKVNINSYNYKLIGTISQYVPFALSVKDVAHQDTGYALNNSGYSIVVPCDPVISLINAFIK